MEVIINNISTVIIAVILFTIIISVIIKLAHDRKKGKSSCGCGCEHCAMQGSCHSGNR